MKFKPWRFSKKHLQKITDLVKQIFDQNIFIINNKKLTFCAV